MDDAAEAEHAAAHIAVGARVDCDGVITVPARADGPSAAAIASLGGRSILTALLDARRTFGGSTVALEDADKRRLTYDELVRASAALSRVIRREVDGPVVALMLPSSAAAVIAYFAVLAAGRIPAMLNFTAGAPVLREACRKADAGAVMTAARFLASGKLDALADVLAEDLPVLRLERMREAITWRDKIWALAAPRLGLLPRARPDDPAAIIFTSGAEGEPKGVVLTHRNLLANAEQVRNVLPLDRVETFFNPLPLFHSYGLGPGMILPLVFGKKLVLHPSPLRVKEVTQRIAETKANVLFATDTFLRQYARAGADGSLSSLHFAVCGAERVRAETRELVRARFGFVVIEGYGVTETSPVLAANHPDDIRDGTVGRFLSGIEARLEPVAGLADAYRLSVRGPNVMAGYLAADGSLAAPPDGWHDTGDVVAMTDGYVSIRGRLKRFAKIGGEMTSLATVEQLAGAVWPAHLHAAAALPGGPKGERIVLLTEAPEPDPSDLVAEVARQGLPQRFLPQRVVPVDAIPLLGTGKIDNVAVARLAADRLAQAETEGVEAVAGTRVP